MSFFSPNPSETFSLRVKGKHVRVACQLSLISGLTSHHCHCLFRVSSFMGLDLLFISAQRLIFSTFRILPKFCFPSEATLKQSHFQWHPTIPNFLLLLFFTFSIALIVSLLFCVLPPTGAKGKGTRTFPHFWSPALKIVGSL